MSWRSSPVNGCSRPPLKKYVTCAYFSVSAQRSCRRPARAITSPNESATTSFGNATGRPRAASYSVMHAYWSSGNAMTGFPRSVSVSITSGGRFLRVSMAEISRIRSGRKLKAKPASRPIHSQALTLEPKSLTRLSFIPW